MLPVIHSAPKKSGLPAVQDLRTDTSLSYRELCERLVPISYPRGTRLCFEGHPATGLFSIYTGRAKEYITSKNGKTAILRFVGPGDLPGLEAAIGDTAYTATIETIEPTTAYFITKRDLLGAMQCDDSFRETVVKQLCDRCRSAYSDMRRLALAASIPARIAQFLLDWPQTHVNAKTSPCIRLNLTHEEIGQAIGTTRETVSRIIGSFRRKGWIHVRGVQWRIENRASLATLAARQ